MEVKNGTEKKYITNQISFISKYWKMKKIAMENQKECCKRKEDEFVPDRLAPATIPVTAGKKTANTEKKLCSSS